MPAYATPRESPDPKRFPAYLRGADSDLADPDTSSRDLVIEERFETESWDGFVRSRPDATMYHDLRWRELISTTFRHETPYLLARDATGSVQGILPLVGVRTPLFGSFAVSLPYVNYAGPLASSPAIAERLRSAAADRMMTADWAYVEFREPRAAAGRPSRSHKDSLVLALPDTATALSASLRAKVRSQARRATKAGATLHEGGIEQLDDFYDVFSRNMRDLGTPVYPKCFFAHVLEHFPSESHICCVRLGRRPVAAGLLVAHGDALEVPWASSVRDYNAISVNMMLYRGMLESAIERGFRFFDFGRSTRNAPTWRFKRQWGAHAWPLHWQYALAEDGELPRLDPGNPRLRFLVSAWKRLPLKVANLLGPTIVRGIP